MDMNFEFDPAKSKRNKLKHGIDFVEAQKLWEDERILVQKSGDPREVRYLLVGRIELVHWSAFITYRGHKVRIISVRRSRRREIDDYEDHGRKS